MTNAQNLLVVNDEAYHAWRINPEAEGKYLRSRDLKDSAEEATVWIGGLDRIHRTRGILNCYDFSATPFTPSGKKSSEEALFGWIVSDFGLNDAIESGLVNIYDITWEASDGFALDESDVVDAWAKNDHLGFELVYVYRGVVRKYRPDFLVRLVSGDALILETKGQDTEQDRVKWRYLDEWTQAVNAHGGFGRWRWAVAHHPGEIKDILLQYTKSSTDKKNG